MLFPLQSRTEPSEFDGDRAYSLLVKQCSFGPRNPGSNGHQACLKWLAEELKSLGGEVYIQPFKGHNPHSGETVTLSNVVARFGPDNQKPVMLCAHWDTRPVADRDQDPSKRNSPIIGANDGASGVAVLLEIARLISQSPPDKAVLIALFDGEDLGRESHPKEYAQGSRYWASHQIPEQPSSAILLDMIGDSDLEIPIEWYSRTRAPELQRTIWSIAEEISATAFKDQLGPAVEDDHVPLLDVGIPAIDLIDFEYPYWHTHQDTPDKCSPASLEQVGKVLIEFIYR